MQFSDWIKAQLQSLREMMSSADADDSSDPAEVEQSRAEDRLVLKFSSSTRNLAVVRRAIESFCETTELDTPAREEIGLVVNEAMANVIRHAYHGATDKPVEIQIERLSGGVKISIRDWGNGQDPSLHPPKEDMLVPGGLGLICIRRLMDKVKFKPQPDGMLLVMSRTTPGSKASDSDG